MSNKWTISDLEATVRHLGDLANGHVELEFDSNTNSTVIYEVRAAKRRVIFTHKNPVIAIFEAINLLKKGNDGTITG